ncbi:3'(2'),5'-bisphosphate nucleotidase CysQ [Kaistia dalseonensis]|uniref:3'(2'),5'-bisphosphate nucleotidase CysQ n=1 Tax=Kaistia dalseonensis TaxID=410840 RepID=A0ABU0HFT7_9HYPH|nr:3'(2'),5'-bisphosphate nucleotidase CysQ [Kaistia dalseonensis]MCX5497752.1 3'(2'),5'-bisphosphate nucleotidase CysQ [Kaistia dalseonensis]MDQ0440396.1 3'(2'),5'-bisphosphate nucleotidase [Kaistia dalseonensis]
MPIENDASLQDGLIATAMAAGVAVMNVYRQNFSVDEKADASPVTEADRQAEEIILAELRKLAPGVPVIAEESCCAGRIPAVHDEFFLVDPVDGTREFICRNGDFTVNIALIRAGLPVLGIVYAPVHGCLFVGRLGHGAERLSIAHGVIEARRPIHVAAPPEIPPRIICSRSHRTAETDHFIGRYPGASLVSAGSSLKFCLMAAGEADLYPRMGPTMQWDTAAGDAVLRAAGGLVSTVDGDPLVYGPRDVPGLMAYANPWFVARGSNQFAVMA